MTRSVTALFWLVFSSAILISFGCPASKESACSSNPCQNNGKCMEDEVKGNEKQFIFFTDIPFIKGSIKRITI